MTQAILYSQAIAGTLLAVKVAFEAWTTYILRQNGDPDADPGGLLFRSVSAAAFISAVPWLVRWIYQFGTNVASDVAKLPGVDYESAGGPMQELLDMLIAQSTYPIFTAIGILFSLILFVIILIQAFIRAAEIAVAAVVGSFMALGLTNPSSSAFSSWMKELISLSMAQAVQMFMVKVSFFTLTYFSFAGIPLLNLLLFCGFLWVTYRSPAILKQYVYSTGVGRAIGSTASNVGSMALMRKVFTRGA